MRERRLWLIGAAVLILAGGASPGATAGDDSRSAVPTPAVALRRDVGASAKPCRAAIGSAGISELAAGQAAAGSAAVITEVAAGRAADIEAAGKEVVAVPPAEGLDGLPGAAIGGQNGTFLARLGDGRLLIATTGTDAGECLARGRRIDCFDGTSTASVDLDHGCLGFTGSGSCTLATRIDPDGGGAFAVGGQEVVNAGNFLCGTGRLSGRKFTLSDVDGSGCTASFTTSKISGASCSHNGGECASMNCEQGCTFFRSGCKCEMSDDTRVPDTAE